MRTQKLLFISFLISFVAFGCDVFNISESSNRIRYEFKAPTIYEDPGKDLNATFQNKASEDLYIDRSGCPIVRVQKYESRQWRDVNLPIMCPAVVLPPLQVSHNEIIEFRIPHFAFSDSTTESGRYRLGLNVRKDSLEDWVKIYSNEFQIDF